MTTVRLLLEDKGHDVHCVHGNDSVMEALKKMDDHDIGSLVVVDDDKITGIITERGFAREVVRRGEALLKGSVQDFMTKNVICVKPNQSVDECMAIMTKKHVRHLPVLEGQHIAGMLSIGDLLKSQSDEQDEALDALEHYIFEDHRMPFQDGEA